MKCKAIILLKENGEKYFYGYKVVKEFLNNIQRKKKTQWTILINLTTSKIAFIYLNHCFIDSLFHLFIHSLRVPVMCQALFQMLRTEQCTKQNPCPRGADILERGEISTRNQEFPDGKLNPGHSSQNAEPETTGLPSN